MKKHLLIISVILFTLAPIKLFTMENEDHKLVIQKFPASNIPIGEFLEAYPEELSKKISALDNTPNEIRNCIFEITAFINKVPRSENTVDTLQKLKMVRKALYTQLSQLKSKQEEKDFCFDVIDNISDSEDEEKSDPTRTNYLKYQKTTSQIAKINQRKKFLSQKLEEDLEIQKKYTAKITDTEKLKEYITAITTRTASEELKEYLATEKVPELTKYLTIAIKTGKIANEVKEWLTEEKTKNLAEILTDLQTNKDNLDNLIKNRQNEFEVLQIAKNLLIHKMEKQKQCLLTEIDTTIEQIKLLSQKSSTTQLTLSDIQKTEENLAEFFQKLYVLRNTLSYLEKDLAEAKGKTSFLANIAWYLGFDVYANIIPPSTTPTADTNQQRLLKNSHQPT